ncbi:MAG: copper-binding protein [Planctomycetes bacterium]|nr:copper-binding protein [Planctomycetota bacterium]
MFKQLTIVIAALCASLAVPMGAQAAATIERGPIEVVLRFGSATDGFELSPNMLQLETGKPYKLVITNPSSTTHYITAPEFAAAVSTRKVEITGGNVERKRFLRTKLGIPRRLPVIGEIELRAGGKAEWYFTGNDAGRFPIECGIPAHAQAGMVGMIIVD